MTPNKFVPPGSVKSLRVEELVGVEGSGEGVPVGEIREAEYLGGLWGKAVVGWLALHR